MGSKGDFLRGLKFSMMFLLIVFFLSIFVFGIPEVSAQAVSCWEYNQSECEAQELCEWDPWGNFCYEKGCWSFTTQEECQNYSSSLGCYWRTEEATWGWCEKKGCWNYNNPTDCENANCTWHNDTISGGGWCEEPQCWQYQDNSTCTSKGCEWQGSGYCYDVNCWDLMDNASCSNESDELDCVWNAEFGYCEEKGPWLYTDNTSCIEAGFNWTSSGWSCIEKEDSICWNIYDQTICNNVSYCMWNTSTGYCEYVCSSYTTQSDCENNSRCYWDNLSGQCYVRYCSDLLNSTSCQGADGCFWEESGWCDYNVSCWEYNETDCKADANCSWVESGWCEGPGECWNYYDSSSCNADANCTWYSSGWCEKKGPWSFTDEANCTAAGFKWKDEGWCTEPQGIQCWNYDYTNESACEANSACEWQDPYCVTKDCWMFTTQSDCNNAPPEMKCEWQTSGGGGWCEQLGCWSFWDNESACKDANSTFGLNCAWVTGRGYCEPLSCYIFTDQTSCENTSDSIDCIWDNGYCRDLGCWDYTSETDCENSTLHPNLNCTWMSDGISSWCEALECWIYTNESACVNNTDGLSCMWDSVYNYCYEPRCWDYTDNDTCSAAEGCVWKTDEWGKGWCEEEGCYSFWDNQAACTNTSDEYECIWKSDEWCEEARCWIFDGTNKTACENNSYGLACSWDNNGQVCNEKFAGCSKYNGNEKGCKDTFYCWWDEINQTCLEPTDEAWKEEIVEEVINPGCWIFDYQEEKCKNVTGCMWINTTSECRGLEDTGVQCSFIKDKDLCEKIPVLDTCCVWRKSKCEADKTRFECYENIQPPPEGAQFCEDTKSYTDKQLCMKIMGEPWFMPCKWEDYGTPDTSDDRCVFRAKEKFGGEVAGCELITNKKDCEFAGCEWKTEYYCKDNMTVPFGWCEPKAGTGSKSCDAACWACTDRASCEASKLGYCAWDESLQECKVREDVMFGKMDCQSDCKACEMKPNPQMACEQSAAGCKWVDNRCYPKSERVCAEDCFRCYDKSSCENKGMGGGGKCVWDSDSNICKPKGFTKEICFDGVDNDNDGKLDCEDVECFKDPFCGASFTSNCWKYDTIDKCTDPTLGGAENCIWIKDTTTGEEWCGVRGENCFLWDGDKAGCENRTECQWFPDPMGGFCEINITKTQDCSKLDKSVCETYDWCILTSDGFCDAKIFRCEVLDNTTCKSDKYKGFCNWTYNEFLGKEACMPICFTKDMNSETACNSNDNCRWMSGICDPAEHLGTSMEDCWKYDDDPAKCYNASACTWHEEPFPFCDLNKSLFKQCDRLNKSACESPPYNETCKWNGDETTGWCDPRPFACGWYTNQSSCVNDINNYGVNCTWVEDPTGNRCEPICFDLDEAACGAEPICEWRTGFCEPKMAKEMFKDVGSPPVLLGFDPCPEGTISNESDICGFGVKDDPDVFGFGINVVSLKDAALCKDKKIIDPKTRVVITSSGTGTNTTKFYWYLDTDGNSNSGCTLFNDANAGGYEFFLAYEALWVDGDLKEKRRALRCQAGEWVVADIKLTGWNTIMCGEIGGGMIAVDKSDLKKFSDLVAPGEPMRVYVATAGDKGNEENPSDTAGPVYYTPGTAEFKFEDCLTPGVDMDGDGLNSENDPDCFLFHEFGFIRFEDCFPGTGDEDEDGLLNCDDPDCKFAPNCEGKGVNAEDYVDTSAPQLIWYEVDEFPDAAFIKYDTNEPANGTVTFYYNDSSCKNTSGMARTIYDVGIIDPLVLEYKNWHDAPIDNFDFNPQALGYNLTNGTTYYYKITVCDPEGNCAVSACLNFTTAKSSSRRDCPDCQFLFKFEGVDNVLVDLGGAGIFQAQAGMCGEAGIVATYSQGLVANIKLESSEVNGSITFENATLTKLSESINITGGTASTTEGEEWGYVGMDSEAFDKIASKLRPKKCRLTIPKGKDSDCSRILYCDEPVNGTINESTCAEVPSSRYALVNETSDYCEIEVPCEFSVYGVGGAIVTSTTPPAAGGGGGGAAAKPRIVLLANSIDLNLSSGFFGFLRNQGIDIVYVNASNFSDYKTEKFIVILGGPDAPEGVGEVVREVLNESEQEELRTPGAKKMYVKANVWRSYNQVVMVIAGSGRDQTREASEDNKQTVKARVTGE